MGRFSEPLAARFVDLLRPEPGQRALDVGCGPGALTTLLVEQLGADAVAAVDPSPSFVDAVRTRLPGIDVRPASAEALPYDDDVFDLSLAQLVVHFMADPVAGLSEMRRVSRAGGVVAASVWDHSGDSGPLSLFWRAVRDLDTTAVTESGGAGARPGHLAELFSAAGLAHVEETILTVDVPFESVDDWWEPYTFGVGPSGEYVARLGVEEREALRARCAELLPSGPFEISASAWCVTGRV
jgi:SAM-dependent methyltransferase